MSDDATPFEVGSIADRSRAGRWSDRGDTLVELLIALAVFGVVAGAIVLGLMTSIMGSSELRGLVTMETVIRSAAEEVTASVQQNSSLAFQCPDQYAQPNPTVPSGYQASLVAPWYWNSGTGTFLSSCVATQPQLITVTVTNSSTGATQSLGVVVYDSTASPPQTGNSPAGLAIVEMPPNGTAAGSVFNVMVAVEDASGNIVTTDGSGGANSLSLVPASSPLGATLSGACSASLELYGVVTFSDCQLTTAGSYSFTSADSALNSSGANFQSGQTPAQTPLTAPTKNLTIAVGPPAQVSFALAASGQQSPSANGTAGQPFSTQPVVDVEDSYGNVVTTDSSAVKLTTTPPPSGSPLSCTTIPGNTTANPVNASGGVATFGGCNIAVTGSFTITASDGTLQPDTSPVTIGGGPPARLVITTQPSATETSGAVLLQQPVVKIEDSAGNVVTSVNSGSATAAIASGAGGSIAAGGISGSFSSGVATFAGLVLNGVNSNVYTLTFTGDGFTSTPSGNITMATGGAAQLVIATQPSATVASGAALAVQPVVKVEDSGGNVVTTDSSTVTAGFTSGGVSVTNPTKAAASGVASFSGLALNALAGPYTLTFSDNGLATAQSSTITVSTGGATQLVITTQPSATEASGAVLGQQPAVKVEDSGGNVVTSVSSGTATAAIASGTGGFIAAGGISGTFSSGVATFAGLALNGVNGNVYTLSFTGGGYTSAPSSTITMATGAANHLVITTQPSATDNSGAALGQQPVVKVVDSGGNVVTTVSTVTAAFTSGGVSLTNPTKATVGGVASFSGLALNAVAGSYTLTFSEGTLPAVVSAPITVSTGGATQLVIATQPSATVASGAALAVQPVVKVEDSGGNVVTTDSSTVTAGFTSGGVSVINPTKAAASGVASFSGLALNALAGPYTLTFSDNGLATAQSSTITVSTGGATQLVVTTQPSATEASGAVLAQQPAVKVEDSGGNVVTSVSSGTATAAIASGTGGSIVAGGTSGTFSSGVATFAGLALNGVNGNVYTLTFTGATFTSAASTSITVVTGAATQLVVTTQPSATEASGAALAQQPVVKVEDSGGNVVTSVSSGTATAAIASGSGGSIAAGGTSGTFSSGVATFAGLALNGVNTNVYTLTFTGATFSSVASTTITMATGAATKLVITAQPSATVASGAALAVQPVVAVEDSGGNVVTTDSSTVTAGFTSGGVSLTNPTKAAASGVASFSGLALNALAGPYTLTFSDGGLITAASNTITVSTGAATQLVVTTQPSATEASGAALAQQPVVKVEDSGGNVVTSVSSGTATAAIASGTGGSIGAGGTSGAFSSGVATFAGLALNGVNGNVYTLTFTGGGFTSAPSSTITMAAGAATHLVITTQPSAAVASGAPLAVQPVVKVEDSGGNVVTTDSSTVTAAFTAGGVSLTNPSKAAAGGVATFSGLALNALAGSYTLTFSDGTLATAVSSTITVTAGAATQLVITTQPSATEASGAALAQQPVVKVEDSGGNVVTSVSSGRATAAIASGVGGSIGAGGTSGTFSSGVATFAGLVLNGVNSNVYTLTFTGDGFTSTPSGNITMATGGAAQLVIATQPSATVASGAALAVQPVVKVEDSGGNVVTTDSSTVTAGFTSGGVSVTNPTKAAASGVASFSGLALNALAGPYTLTFSDNGLATAQSSTITVSTGGATQLVITTQPSATEASGAVLGQQPAVTVEDSGGNVVTSVSSGTATAAIASGSGGFIAAGGISGTFSSGVATFAGLALNGVNTTVYTLIFTGDGFTSPASGSITMATGAATKLVIATQPSATEASGAALGQQPVVAVEDSGGNVVTAASTVTARFTAGGVSLTNPTEAAASGVASFSGLALNALAGSYTLTFSDGALTTAVSSTITVTAGATTQLVIATQPSATVASGAALAVQPVVKVEDSGGNVVTTDSSTVTAGFTSGGVSVTNPTKAAASGVASFSGLALNALAGPYTLTFSDNGLATAQSSTITVSTGGATQLVITTQPSATEASGAVLGQQPAVTVEDSGGNVVTSVSSGTATAAIASGSGGFIAAGGISGTFSSGVATFAGLALNGVNTTVYTLIFTGDGFTSPASGSITMATGAATKLVIATQPSATEASGAALGQQPVVAVEDSGGNVVTAASTVTARFTAGGVSLTNPTEAAASGVASFSGLALNALAGSYTLTFSDGALTTAVSSTITVTAGATTQLVIATQPSATVASGAALAVQPVVKVEDSGGNVVTTDSSTVTAGFTSGGVSVTNPTKAAASGVASFSGLALNALAGPYTLTFSDNGLATAQSSTITVSTGGATQLVITTQPSATEASGAVLGQQPAVTVEDSGGNVVTSVSSGTATAAIASGSGGFIAAGGISGTFSSGVATFAGLALNGVNTTVYTLIFTGDGFTSPASGSITMATGAATKVVIATQPSATEASGAALGQQPVVKVEDSGGNVVTSLSSGTATAAIASGSGGSIAAGGISGTFSSGVATFAGLALNGVNTTVYTLTFTGDGFTSPASGSITMATGAATKLVIATQPSATEASGAALGQQPVVKVEDSGGNVVTSLSSGTATAAIASGSGGSIAAGGISGTFSSGVATFAGLALNGVNTTVYTLTFTGDGFTSPASGSITMATGAATKLVIATQPSATEASGAALGQQPAVKVEDSGGNVVTSVSSGTATAAIASGSGGSIAAGGISGTFSSGVATFAGLALNGVNTTVYTLTFTGDGFTSPASTNITVSTGAATQLVIATQPSATEASGAALGQQPAVKVEDSGGNVVTSVSSGTATAAIASGSGGSIAAGGISGTFSSGVATFAGLALNGVNTTVYTLTFTGDGFTSPASGSITMATGAATKLVIATQPSATEASGAALGQQPAVKVEDSGGNVVTSVSSGTATAAIASGSGGSIAAGGISGTFSSGVATFAGLALNGVNTTVYTLTFTGDGFTSPASTNITVSTGAATHLVFTQQPVGGVTEASNFATQPKVSVEDTNGNLVTSDTGNVTLSIASYTPGNGGTVPGTLTCTTNPIAAVAGVASFTNCQITGTSAAGTYTLSAGRTGLTSGTSSGVVISAGTAAILAFTTQPTSGQNIQATGTGTFTVAVAVQDANGNTELADNATTVNLAINNNAGPGGVLTCANTGGLGPVTVANGVANFTGCAINNDGNGYTLTATSSPARTAPANANSFNITAGTATQLVFTTQPTSGQNIQATGTGSFVVAVAVEDADGDIEVADNATTVNLAINNNAGPGGVMTCANTGGLGPVTVANGVANFTGCAINNDGNGYTLTATSSPARTAPANANSFNITAGTATQLVFTQEPGSDSGTGGLSPEPAVAVADADGNVEVGNSTTTVTLAINTNPGTGTLACYAGTTPPGNTLTVTVSLGVASFSGCGIAQAGAGPTSGYKLQATSSPAFGTVVSSSFSVTTSAPTITSPTASSPCNPGHNGTANCTITGTNLAAGARVTVSANGTVNSVTWNSATQITINVKGSGGNGATGNITVTNPDGGVAIVTNGFANG